MRIRAKLDFKGLIRDGRKHQGVWPGETYFVLEVTHDEYRVVDNKGEPVLYPKEMFDVLDSTIPSHWQFCEYEGGEYHLEPVRTGVAGFYEDFFGSDGDESAQKKARTVLREELMRTSSTVSLAEKELIERALSVLPGE